MLAACEAALPADIAVCVAAVADWRPDTVGAGKIKKGAGGPPTIALVENPDILATLSKAARHGRGWWWASPPRPTTVEAHATRQAGAQGLRLDRRQ